LDPDKRPEMINVHSVKLMTKQGAQLYWSARQIIALV